MLSVPCVLCAQLHHINCTLLIADPVQTAIPSVTSQQQMKVDFGQSLTVNGRKVTRDEQRKYNCGRIYCREIVKASDKAWYRGLVPVMYGTRCFPTNRSLSRSWKQAKDKMTCMKRADCFLKV